MDISIFLAKIVGTYFLIMFIAMLINTRLLKRIFIQIYSNPVLFFLVGVTTLLLGIVLVVAHNLWTSDWRVLITVIAWITLLKGVYIVIFPQFKFRQHFGFLHTNLAYYCVTGLIFIVGVFLSYCGFSAITI